MHGGCKIANASSNTEAKQFKFNREKFRISDGTDNDANNNGKIHVGQINHVR